MGDPYKPIIWVPGCSISSYPDETEPAALLVNIDGVRKGAAWESWMGEPPDGTFLFVHSACATWVNNEIGAIARLRLSIYGYWLDWWLTDGAIPYFTSIGYGDLTDQVDFGDSETDSSDPFYSGIASAYTNAPQPRYPASWDANEYFNLPTAPGYFADEFPSSIHDRYLRYACHRDKTNFKVWLND